MILRGWRKREDACLPRWKSRGSLRLHPAYIARPLCPDLCFNPGARKFLRPLRIAIIAALRPDKLTEFFKSAAVCHRLLRKPISFEKGAEKRFYMAFVELKDVRKTYRMGDVVIHASDLPASSTPEGSFV